MSWYRCPVCHTKIDVGPDIEPRPICVCGAAPPPKTTTETDDDDEEINMGGATSPLVAPEADPENE